jgi:glycosyltransferase involved in cell wall biosynthesis
MPRVVIVMPAYNAEKTLELTYRDIPPGLADEIILVDDASRDRTVEIARHLGLTVIAHPRNRGYGGNQKTCYAEALRRGADIVLMLHPDYQYAPQLAPEMIAPLREGRADMVLGSRLLQDRAIKGGMPRWKWLGNKLLTGIQNAVLRQSLSEYHTGYRAYTRRTLETIPFQLDGEDFVFDQEFVVQALHLGLRVAEIAIPTKYFLEASSVSLRASVVYGLKTLYLLGRYILHRWGVLAYPLLLPVRAARRSSIPEA